MRHLSINKYIERYKYLTLAFLFLISGIMIETNLFTRVFDKDDLGHFQNTILKKEAIAQKVLADISILIENNNKNITVDTLFELAYSLKQTLDNRDISFVIFKNDTAFFWTDNSFYLERYYSENNFTFPLLKIDHNIFVTEKSEINEFKILIFSLIKKEYLYENNFLISGFQDDFNIQNQVQVINDKSIEGTKIFKSNGDYLFSLVTQKNGVKNKSQLYVVIVLYFLAIVLFLFFLHNYLRKISRSKYSYIINITFFFLAILGRYLMIIFQKPNILYSTELFSPQYYALSDFIPSLGDLLINAFLILYFIVQLKTE
ncbi:MAG: hypothetical protein IPO21_16615 [Bacteroidales bacterium]|nr:hypothetical protein [Bacteroidales bacterium]